MVKKCNSSSSICISPLNIVIVLCISIICLIIYFNMNEPTQQRQPPPPTTTQQPNEYYYIKQEQHKPFYDAYHPPYNLLNRRKTPTEFEQIGFLTYDTTILPLFGRKLHSGRDKWNYYTMTDKFVSVKVPVIKNGKNGLNEYGCDEIMDGETVYVHGYNELFKATIYQTQTPIYIPY